MSQHDWHVGSIKRGLEAIVERMTGIETRLDGMIVKIDRLGNLKTHIWLGVLTVAVTVLGASMLIQRLTVSSFRAADEVSMKRTEAFIRSLPPPGQKQQQPIIINVPAGAAPSPPAAPPPGK